MAHTLHEFQFSGPMAAALSLKSSHLYDREEPLRDRRVRYEAKNARKLQKVYVELKIDKGALEDDEDEGISDWETIKAILNFLGYEPKFVHATMVSRSVMSERDKIIQLSASKINRHHQNRKRIVTITQPRGNRFKVPRMFPKLEGCTQILNLAV